MKKIVSMLTVCLVFLVTGPTLSGVSGQPETDEQTTRRFALVVGANNGGAERVKLKYAVSDAKALIEVLESMGGVSPDDSRLLVDPKRDTLFWELKRLKDRIRRAKEKHPRVEVIFYYSGHSDEQNILLGEEKVTYKEFRDSINGMSADVRIAILDSCASGAFTRLKGGKKKKPFLVDAAYDMKGYAVMTSSSSDEASQESERLKGSFFTHYLNSGLRGAADMSQDGRITLTEAYHFAFNETLAQTEKTISGPQHPNYDIKMAGTGDVVITDIRKSSSILRIGKEVFGKIFIHDEDQVLVLELSKAAGRSIELGMEKGKYRIINIKRGEVWESRIKLPEGETVDLTRDRFELSEKIDTVARGDLNPRRTQPNLVKKKKLKKNLFVDLNSRVTTINGGSSVLSGWRLGMTFNKAVSFGFVGFNEISPDDNNKHKAYHGFLFEYAFPSSRVYNLKAGLIMAAGSSKILDANFLLAEPEIMINLFVTRTINVGTGFSFRIISRKGTGIGAFSWNLSLRLGK